MNEHLVFVNKLKHRSANCECQLRLPTTSDLDDTSGRTYDLGYACQASLRHATARKILQDFKLIHLRRDSNPQKFGWWD